MSTSENAPLPEGESITDFESTFENPATSLLIRLLLHNTEPFDFEHQNELKKSQRRVNARGVVAKKCCHM
eukprot:scaffold1347_cov189-Chaetoceros_neogracile.AAC.3